MIHNSRTFLKLSHFKMKNYFNDQLGLFLAYKSVQLSNHRCSFVYEELQRCLMSTTVSKQADLDTHNINNHRPDVSSQLSCVKSFIGLVPLATNVWHLPL